MVIYSQPVTYMDIIIEVITDQNFLGAILACVTFILIGFFLRNKNIISDTGKDVLKVIVMKVAIPCMAFVAFMSDFSSNDFVSNLLIFVLDLLFYIIFILLGNLIFFKYEKMKRRIYGILTAVGQLSFFSMPILQAVYGSESGILIPCSMMSIAFRLVVYIYSYLVITESKITRETFLPTTKTIFINPVMIFMFIGLLIWTTQNITFQIDVDGINYGFLRIDKTLPALYQFFKWGNYMATPLCMLLVGVTLGESDFKEAIKNKIAWIIAFIRSLVFPIMILGLCLLVQVTHIIDFNEISLAAMVIGNAAPISAVVAVFCVSENKEAYIASDGILLSTILSLISMPILFVLVKTSLTLPIF